MIRFIPENDPVCLAQIANMVDSLEVLRAKAGLTRHELAMGLDLHKQTYLNIINKKQQLTWRNYLLFAFLFDAIPASKELLHHLDLYPHDFVVMMAEEGTMNHAKKKTVRIPREDL